MSLERFYVRAIYLRPKPRFGAKTCEVILNEILIEQERQNAGVDFEKNGRKDKMQGQTLKRIS